MTISNQNAKKAIVMQLEKINKMQENDEFGLNRSTSKEVKIRSSS